MPAGPCMKSRAAFFLFFFFFFSFSFRSPLSTKLPCLMDNPGRGAQTNKATRDNKTSVPDQDVEMIETSSKPSQTCLRDQDPHHDRESERDASFKGASHGFVWNMKQLAASKWKSMQRNRKAVMQAESNRFVLLKSRAFKSRNPKLQPRERERVQSPRKAILEAGEEHKSS
ncbi:uncharacterized protein UTRI_05791 [Ustilago trichophora]|uniref:Secreted protein n=1 Tax=Ustilago trichophora TaxID=86804 RepID=A0A5C3EKQ0_9BASI|nr:uncharacterized protein UTRI_05791 [Ustilago trichophora]